MANAEKNPSLPPADHSVSGQHKKTRMGLEQKGQKHKNNADGGRDEQGGMPSSSSRAHEEDIQSGMSKLKMKCSDDENVPAEESSSAQGILMPREEVIQSSMSQLEMTCSDDEDLSAEEIHLPQEHPSVKAFHDKQKKRNPHLKFPTPKDTEVLQSSEEYVFCKRCCGQALNV